MNELVPPRKLCAFFFFFVSRQTLHSLLGGDGCCSSPRATTKGNLGGRGVEANGLLQVAAFARPWPCRQLWQRRYAGRCIALKWKCRTTGCARRGVHGGVEQIL